MEMVPLSYHNLSTARRLISIRRAIHEEKMWNWIGGQDLAINQPCEPKIIELSVNLC